MLSDINRSKSMPNSNENNPSPGTGLHFLNEDEHTNQPLDPINVDEISLANNLSEFFLEDEFTENDLKNFIGEEEFNSLSVEDRRINLDKINQLNKQKELGGSLDRLKAWSQNGGDVFGSGARDDSGRNAGSGQDAGNHNRQNFGDGSQNGPAVESRCYALAAMAASALKEGGSKRLDQLINNLGQIYSSADADMVDLKKAIDKFHQYANDAFAVKKEDLLFTLDTICDTIGKVDASAQYKLGTLNLQSGLGHAMMVGVDVTSKGKKFYFFDPTSRDTYIQNDDINQFKASLIQKLSLDINLVKQYNFEFKAFDTTSF